MNSYQHNTYKQNTHMVSKTHQIIMLYDGTIKFLKQAKEAINENRLEDRYWSIQKALDILSGLQICLDFENGGEIANLLYDYYSGLDMRISSVHSSHSLDELDLCIKHLKIMRDAWKEVDQKHNESASETITPDVPAENLAEENMYDPSLAKSLAEAGLSVSA